MLIPRLVTVGTLLVGLTACGDASVESPIGAAGQAGPDVRESCSTAAGPEAAKYGEVRLTKSYQTTAERAADWHEKRHAVVSKYRQLSPQVPVFVCVFDGRVNDAHFPAKRDPRHGAHAVVYDRLVFDVVGGVAELLEAGNHSAVADAGPR